MFTIYLDTTNENECAEFAQNDLTLYVSVDEFRKIVASARDTRPSDIIIVDNATGEVLYPTIY